MSARTTRIMVIAMLFTPFLILFFTFMPPSVLRLGSALFCNPGDWLDGGLTNDDLNYAEGRSLPNGFYCTNGEYYINVSDTLIGVIAIMIIVPYVLLIASAVWDYVSHRRLLRTGESGVGYIQSTRATGLRINSQPVYELVLMVHSHTQPPFETTVRSRIGPFMSLDSIIPVRFDPVSKRAIIVRGEAVDESLVKRRKTSDFVLNKEPSGGDTLKDKLEQLKDAYDAGLITSTEYEERRQHLIKSL